MSENFIIGVQESDEMRYFLVFDNDTGGTKLLWEKEIVLNKMKFKNAKVNKNSEIVCTTGSNDVLFSSQYITILRKVMNEDEALFKVAASNGKVVMDTQENVINFMKKVECSNATVVDNVIRGVNWEIPVEDETGEIIDYLPAEKKSTKEKKVKEKVADNSPFKVQAGVLTKVDMTAAKGDVVIPDNVKKIGARAFFDCKEIKSLYIPDTVTEIGDYAFSRCVGIEKVRLSNSLVKIGGYAFSSNEKLTEIELPESLKEIGEKAFNRCIKLTSVNIPESVEIIGDEAFSSTGLTSVKVPDSVKRLGAGAFKSCLNLKDVDTGNGIKAIADDTFSGSGLKTIIIGDNVKSIGNKAFCGTHLEEIEIPFGVEKLGDRVFMRCPDLKEVVVSDSVKEIGQLTFALCKELKKVTLPACLETLKYATFAFCFNLEKVNVPDMLDTIEEYAFAKCFYIDSEPFMDTRSVEKNAFKKGDTPEANVKLPVMIKFDEEQHQWEHPDKMFSFR